VKQNHSLLIVLALSLFSFALLKTQPAVLGDTTQKTSANRKTIPCEVVIPIIDTYCQNSSDWILCTTLKKVISDFCFP
jgi:hypothetical protein